MILLGAAVFLELAGAVLFVLNNDIGAFFLVRAHLSVTAAAGCTLLCATQIDMHNVRIWYLITKACWLQFSAE